MDAEREVTHTASVAAMEAWRDFLAGGADSIVKRRSCNGGEVGKTLGDEVNDGVIVTVTIARKKAPA